MTTRRELFGGAITMDLPSNFIDASDLRQVPDTQEVFLDLESDMSVIVEVLQRVDTEDAAQAVMFHFDSLAHDNSAGSQKILNVALPNELETTSPPETPPPIILHGEQIVQKFNRTTLDRVCMFVALYRIKAKQVDLVLTANIPTTLTESLQSDEATFQRLSKKKFDRAVESLKVLDFELFV